MKYQLEMDIGVPRERVIELFLDSDNLPKWQTSLVSFEHVEGTPREVGAKSVQVHKMGNREMEMTETITANNLPGEYSATYEAPGIWNLVENRFTEAGPDKTHWVLDNEYKASGFMGVMAFLFPGMFKKQTLTFMNLFKEFCESASD